jgi:hypothetical protein
MSEPDPKIDDKSKLTGVGCVVTLLSVCVIVCVAIPIVRWRDPAGVPLPRTVAIVAPILIGAMFQGSVAVILKFVGISLWSDPESDETSDGEIE